MAIYYESAGAVRLHHADVLEALAAEADGSAQTAVTSPPYWGLRDYGLPPTDWPEVSFVPAAGLPHIVIPTWRGSLGREADPWAYVGHLVHVFRALRRVLKSDGTLWLNLGDSYAGARGGSQGKAGLLYLRAASRRGVRERKETRAPAGLKHKDMCGIPWRAAFALQADGWRLRSDTIWSKPNPLPESVKDRPTKAHEYVFLFSKGSRYFYSSEALKEPAQERKWVAWSERRAAGEASRMGDPGESGHVTTTDTLASRPGRNARSVWTIPTQPYHGAHFATMPPALAERCILAGSRPGDTVLDPFNGAGTTGLVAMRLGRRYVGTELNATYCASSVARWREEFSLFLPAGVA